MSRKILSLPVLKEEDEDENEEVETKTETVENLGMEDVAIVEYDDMGRLFIHKRNQKVQFRYFQKGVQIFLFYFLYFHFHFRFSNFSKIS